MKSVRRLQKAGAVAVEAGDWATILQMLKVSSLAVDQVIRLPKCRTRVSLLAAAIECKATAVALWLIKHGAPIDGLEESRTPLMRAVEARETTLVNALLSHGADVNQRAGRTDDGERGYTALMLAAESGCCKLIAALLRAGANPALKTSWGRTAVYFALSGRKDDQDSIRIARRLVAAGCPLVGNELHLPVYYRGIRRVRLLIQLMCPVNMKAKRASKHGNIQGDTPLCTAIRWNVCDIINGDDKVKSRCKRTAIVRALLSAGADPNIADRKGWSPLMLIRREADSGIRRMLMRAGAIEDSVNHRILARQEALLRKSQSAVANQAPDKDQKEFMDLWNTTK